MAERISRLERRIVLSFPGTQETILVEGKWNDFFDSLYQDRACFGGLRNKLTLACANLSDERLKDFLRQIEEMYSQADHENRTRVSSEEIVIDQVREILTRRGLKP